MMYKLILSLLVFQAMNCQEIKIDNYSFLLGTLNDYMGRSSCMGKTIVDHYDKSEIALINYHIENLKNEFDDLTIDSTHFLISPKLSKKINNDFIWKESEYGLCSNRVDANGNPIDIEYEGKLDWEKVLKTDTQKASYVLGILIRNKFNEDPDTYSVTLPNSFNAFTACVNQIYMLGCDYVKTEMFYAIPCSYSITFTPKEKFKSFLEKNKE